MGVWTEDRPRAEASFHSQLNITRLLSEGGVLALMNGGEFFMNDGEFLLHLLRFRIFYLLVPISGGKYIYSGTV